jgi:hypothetical protein
LGDAWTSRSFGGFGFRFGLLFPCLADRPRGARGPSAWRSSSRCSSCSSRVLEHFGFDAVGQSFLTGGCLADRPPGRRRLSARHELLADHQRTWYGLSTCRGAGWVVLLVFNGQSAVGRGPSARCPRTVRPWVADRPPGVRGLSAPGSRTVRPALRRIAKSFASCFVLLLWDRLGFVPRIGRSVVTT